MHERLQLTQICIFPYYYTFQKYTFALTEYEDSGMSARAKESVTETVGVERDNPQRPALVDSTQNSDNCKWLLEAQNGRSEGEPKSWCRRISWGCLWLRDSSIMRDMCQLVESRPPEVMSSVSPIYRGTKTLRSTLPYAQLFIFTWMSSGVYTITERYTDIQIHGRLSWSWGVVFLPWSVYRKPIDSCETMAN